MDGVSARRQPGLPSGQRQHHCVFSAVTLTRGAHVGGVLAAGVAVADHAAAADERLAAVEAGPHQYAGRMPNTITSRVIKSM